MNLQALMRSESDPRQRAAAQRFFKTGPGEYGAGDLFLGGFTMGRLRELATAHDHISSAQLTKVLKSPYHEERMVGVLILVRRYQQANSLAERQQIVQYYLQQKRALNNWDLVDASAYHILGDYCCQIKSAQLIHRLSRSRRHWDRRMAMVATLAYIRQQQVKLTYQLARQFLKAPEDLMHKATGWMLREAGKRDSARLHQFINQYGSRMPRTMLRYAIEKFSPRVRQTILKSTR